MVVLRIDMSLVDKAVFQIIAQHRDTDGFCRLTIQQIAAQAKCHWNTAWRATQRLEAAQRIRKISRGGTRLGIHYQVVDDQRTATHRFKLASR